MRRIAFLVVLVSACGGTAPEHAAVYLVDDWTGRLVRVDRDVRLFAGWQGAPHTS